MDKDHLAAAPEQHGELPEPMAWAAGTECNARGFIDVMAWSEGEFTVPLYTADQLRAVRAEADAEIARLRAELELRRKSGSASDRLHNLCEGIARYADGSEWSREEWERRWRRFALRSSER